MTTATAQTNDGEVDNDGNSTGERRTAAAACALIIKHGARRVELGGALDVRANARGARCLQPPWRISQALRDREGFSKIFERGAQNKM